MVINDFLLCKTCIWSLAAADSKLCKGVPGRDLSARHATNHATQGGAVVIADNGENNSGAGPEVLYSFKRLSEHWPGLGRLSKVPNR